MNKSLMKEKIRTISLIHPLTKIPLHWLPIKQHTTVHLNDEWKNCHMFCGTKCVKSVSSVNIICKTYGKYLPFPPYFFFFTWPGVNYSNSTNLQQLAWQCMFMYVSGQNISCSFYILVTNSTLSWHLMIQSYQKYI